MPSSAVASSFSHARPRCRGSKSSTDISRPLRQSWHSENLSHVGGVVRIMESNFTPLGELKQRVTFPKKIKQLQRPWQHDHEVPSRQFTRPTSSHTQGGHHRVRPRSGGAELMFKSIATYQTGGGHRYYNSRASSQRRPATGTLASSLSSENSRILGGLTSSFNASLVHSALTLDGTVAHKNTPKSVAPAMAKVSIHPSLSSPSLFVAKYTAHDDAKAPIPRSVGMSSSENTDQKNFEERETNGRLVPLPADSSSNTNTVAEAGEYQRVAVTPPLPARMKRGLTRSTQFVNQSGNKINLTKPVSERGPPIFSDKGGLCHDAVGLASASVGRQKSDTRGETEAEQEGRDLEGKIGSLIKSRTSVKVMLPQLQRGTRGNYTRFRPGSTIEGRAIARMQAGKHNARGINGRNSGEIDGVPNGLDMPQPIDIVPQLAMTTFADAAKSGQGRLDAEQPSYSEEKRMRSHNNANRESTAGSIFPSHIDVLEYFIQEGRGQSLLSPNLDMNPTVRTTPAFNGRALVRSNRSLSASTCSSDTPAVVPGRQPFCTAHPLSPTSVGSPPRRHRNSNWGEEGVPLALEEVENSRSTIPYVVSGTMLGWKLSTRGRKQSLVNSLKASEYSDHHPIPVYGFRYVDESNGAAPRERRLELKRIAARALAAERLLLERRARAEGGAGGAAFARITSRRALARADRIQKIGDVLDVRKENLQRGSSPEIVRAYRKHVNDRLRCKFLRKRAERGLSLQRPPRICAVTCRADLLDARETSEAKLFEKCSDASERCSFTGELAQEPCLMLVGARQLLEFHED